MKKDFSCGVIPVLVAGDERRYLLVQHNAGHWGFPKGHPEPGESVKETAVRELAEETGITAVRLLDPPLDEHYAFTKRSGKRVSKTVTYFIGLVEDEAVTVQASEVSDFAWGNAAQTRERLSFHEGRDLLDRAESHLASVCND